MKSLLTKILLALIVSAVLALLINTVLSRVALNKGFVQFLEQQEERQLHNLAPELVDYYRHKGSWDELRNNPRRWMRLLVQGRPEGFRPPDEVPDEFSARRPPDKGPRRGPSAERLWRRLFLLDQHKQWVAGANEVVLETARMLPIKVNGANVGYLGFQPAPEVVSPEARRYIKFQNQVFLISVLLAVLVSSTLAYLLARHLSRPVTRLRDTVEVLTQGHFEARAEVVSEDEIGDLARHVNRLAKTLQQNESARRRWTADVAHELRTPLAVLSAELDAIKDGVREFSGSTLDSLGEEVSHLTRLVTDLQTLALADAGALNVHLEVTDLAGLLRQVLEAFSSRIEASGLRLETDIPPRLEILADPQRMRQLLHNLLENSCRYTWHGGTLRLKLMAEENKAVLLLEDSEPGVEAGDLEQLFDRFYRVDASRARVRGGSGLGLSICRTIVEAHHGEISAQRSSLGGLAIRVVLPQKI